MPGRTPPTVSSWATTPGIHNSIGHYAPKPANEQIMRTARLLKAGTGVWPVWYRSPFNLYHSQGMRSVAAAGMLVAIDSNDPLDYHGYYGKELVDRIDVKLRPGQIILLHHYAKRSIRCPLSLRCCTSAATR